MWLKKGIKGRNKKIYSLFSTMPQKKAFKHYVWLKIAAKDILVVFVNLETFFAFYLPPFK